jgi:hypothetical protein|tara:strand:+ start:198 stop:386 length:189 start_codon:yes stop_codon:yes gene_type:complete
MHADVSLKEIELEELILVTGSFIFSGNKLEDIDTDVIMKLRELADAELEYRTTGIPQDTQIH